MVFNHYRFFIPFNVTRHLSVMAVTIILDVVIDCVIGNLMCCLIKNTTKFRFFVILNDEDVMNTENWDVLLGKVITCVANVIVNAIRSVRMGFS